MSQREVPQSRLYPHPFSRDYWRDAAAEFKNTKMLIFAALMIALRVALKSIRIPIGPELNISIAFFVNALGAMTFGPVVAMAAAVVSDTLGALLFPSGPYFFPFIFTEMAGSLVFALFLYRAKLTVARVTTCRFCIDFFVNIVLQTPVMALYYQVMLGKTYNWLNWMRIAKNLVLFPFESVLLVLFLRLAVPPLRQQHIVKSTVDDLKFNQDSVLTMIALTLLSVAAAVLYTLYKEGIL